MFFPLLMEGSWVNNTDLQALYLSGTYCHKTCIRPPSCVIPRQPTINTLCYNLIPTVSKMAMGVGGGGEGEGVKYWPNKHYLIHKWPPSCLFGVEYKRYFQFPPCPDNPSFICFDYGWREGVNIIKYSKSIAEKISCTNHHWLPESIVLLLWAKMCSKGWICLQKFSVDSFRIFFSSCKILFQITLSWNLHCKTN